MAGAGSRPHADAFMQQIVQSSLVTKPTLTHDARPLVGGGTESDSGIALIAGTGSFSYCRTADGIEDRCGGWGYLYGDEGSGYSLGIAGLRAAVMAHDGRCPPTQLLSGFQEWLGNDVPRWLTELRNWDRDQVAGAAKIVCQCASSGDKTALRLIDQAADALAQHLATLWNRQFFGETSDIVLAGGLLVGNDFLRTKVIDSFLASGCKAGTVTLVQRSSDAMIRMLERMSLQNHEINNECSIDR
jgi:N-acetylglucosamine kinase-like BadF-type ATPase